MYILCLSFVCCSGFVFCTVACLISENESAGLHLLTTFSAVIISTVSCFAMMTLKADEYVTGEKLEHLLKIDQMTGVLNKTEFSRLAQYELDAMVPGTLCALVMIDMDGFKAVNDTLGHFVGGCSGQLCR